MIYGESIVTRMNVIRLKLIPLLINIDDIDRATLIFLLEE